MKVTEFRKLIREEIRKVMKEGVSKAELKTMKATVGYVVLEGPTYDIPEFWPSYVVQDIEYVSFEEGAKQVLEFAKDHDASPEDLKKMGAKLQKLKTMGTKFVSYSFESDVSIGVL